jgi:hypothetical protein
MRIDVQWLSEEKRILHIIFHRNWDWNDFQEHRKRAKELVRNVPYAVSVLMEFDKDAQLLPTNALRNLSIAAETAHPNAGLVVLVMPSQLWRIVIVLLKRLLPNSAMQNSHIVNSREEALALLDNYAESSSS